MSAKLQRKCRFLFLSCASSSSEKKKLKISFSPVLFSSWNLSVWIIPLDQESALWSSIPKPNSFARNAFRKEGEKKKIFLFSFSILKEAGWIPDAPAYFCLLPHFKAIFSLPKYARKSNTSPAALGEGPALQLLLSLDGKRETDRDTVDALDISRSYQCPTKEVWNINAIGNITWAIKKIKTTLRV